MELIIFTYNIVDHEIKLINKNYVITRIFELFK